GKDAGRAPLIVVLQEPAQPALILEPGPQMVPHRPGVAFAQPIVEALVRGIVEALLLHGPLEVPVDLGHEAEPGITLPYLARGLGPEGLGVDAPGALEHVGEHQHRHVAADAVALS